MADVYSEEALPIPVGLGLDTYNHPANIPDGFCTRIENLIARGDRLESRKGFSPPVGDSTVEPYTSANGHHYAQLPNSGNEDFPVFMYGTNSGGTCFAARQLNREDIGTTASSTSIREFPGITGFQGACIYLDKLYVNYSAGIDSIAFTPTSWSAGTITPTSIVGAPSPTNGLFIFKDRLWTHQSNKIYYTDVPTSPGAYPEVWNTSTNFIVINAAQGLGFIYTIIPSDTKLFVFTSSGLYTISVLGSPVNWVVRLLDATVTVNQWRCAYEHQGLIYFVDTQGVKVTNGAEVNIISNSIEDIFRYEDAPIDEYYRFKLMPFEDGIIICKQNLFIDGTLGATTARFLSDAEIYYTRLDNIAWTKFTFDTTSQPGDVIGGFSQVEVANRGNRSSYLVIAHGTSTRGSPANLTSQLLEYTGYQDKLTPSGSSEQTASVTGVFESKLIRGQFLQRKRAKYAYLNLSTNDAVASSTFNLDVKWSTEELTDVETTDISALEIADHKEGLVRVSSNFIFRHLIAKVNFTLTSAVNKYVFLGLAVVLHTDAKTGRQVS